MLRYWLGLNGPTGYGSATTAEQVAADHAEQIVGRVALVTGAASGLGYETARVLCKYGATVYVHARSSDKAADVIARLKKDYPDAQVKPLVADLASLSSIETAAAQFRAEGSPLHLLINNAGVMACPLQVTEDGVELQFATNHLAHYCLTQLLLPVLKRSAPARVVTVSSIGHLACFWSGMQFDNLDGRKWYSPWVQYAHSKMANILFTREMQAREIPGVTFYSLHPGTIITKLHRYALGLPSLNEYISRLPFGKSVEQGAATTVFCALDDRAQPGEYHEDCNPCLSSWHPRFRDMAQAKQLAEISHQLIAQSAIKRTQDAFRRATEMA